MVPYDFGIEELNGDGEECNIIKKNGYAEATDYGIHLELDVILDVDELILCACPCCCSDGTNYEYRWVQYDVELEELNIFSGHDKDDVFKMKHFFTYRMCPSDDCKECDSDDKNG